MLQPLDVKIFSILKSISRRLFMERMRKDPTMQRKKSDACADLVRAWEMIEPESIKNSFDELKNYSEVITFIKDFFF